MSASASTTTVLATPSTRLGFESRLGEKAKKRVDAAGPNGGRCLITNKPHHQAVRYCHLIVRHTSGKDDRMDSLEFWWHMRHKSLNLDTRYNVFKAVSDLHFLHDQGEWGLLPSESIVGGFYAKVTRSSFPDKPNGVFEYTFIPLSANMQENSITRQINPANPLTLADIQSFVYPFTDLPKLESHVHPKFAIYELGRKLAPIYDHDLARYDALLTLWPSLHQVLNIYNAWSRPIPADRPPSFKSISSSSDEDKNKDGDFDDSKTNRTDHHRIRPDRNLRKRQRSEHGDGDGSPKPSGARQAGLGSSLSHETLVEHEHLVGESGWTRENFLKWVESVPRVCSNIAVDLGG